MANTKGRHFKELSDFYNSYKAPHGNFQFPSHVIGKTLPAAIMHMLSANNKENVSPATIARAFKEEETISAKSADLIRFALGKLFPDHCPSFIVEEHGSDFNIFLGNFIDKIDQDISKSDKLLTDSKGTYNCIRPTPDTIYKGCDWDRKNELVKASVSIHKTSSCIGRFEFNLSNKEGHRSAIGTVVSRFPFLYLMGFCENGNDIFFFTFQRDAEHGALKGMQLYISDTYPDQQSKSVIARAFGAIPQDASPDAITSIENWIKGEGRSIENKGNMYGLVLPFQILQTPSALN